MSNIFGINQRIENRTHSSSIPFYSSTLSSQVEVLAGLGYAKQRSRIDDQWLVYATAQSGEVVQ